MSSILSSHGEIRNAFQLSDGERKRPIERWKYNTMGILKEYDVTRTGFSGIGGGSTSLGHINSGRDLYQQSNGHWFYKNLISGIIHSLDYHHNSVFKIKLKFRILGIVFHACT